MVTRRRVLGAALATTGAGLFTSAALTPLFVAREAAGEPAGAAGPRVEPFQVALPIPPVARPVSTAGGTDTYEMTLRPAKAEILPGVQTDVLTFDGVFPGPTIKARSGRPVVIRQTNRLDGPAAVHLHGANVPQESDGDPMDTFAPGRTKSYTYPNNQPHASLWYHDHAHHLEAEHVYRGLSGSYLLSDDLERALPLPSGAYDLPIALRDARFDANGQLVYVMDDVLGRTTLLANGKPMPYLKVSARKYRLRLLNASNLRFFHLRLADGGPITQIGSDGGLLAAPHTTDALWLSPGERADVVVDFGRYPVGTKLVLENKVGPGTPEEVGQVLRFDVVRKTTDPSTVPAKLRTLPRLPAVTGQRSIELRMDEDGGQHAQAYIDGKIYDPARVDISVRHGASEIWTVRNVNELAPHNFHMHLVQFRVLERNGKAPDPSESGLKDTVRMLPGDTVKLQATFDSYRGTYVYHCHMLDHSAMGMMARLRIG